MSSTAARLAGETDDWAYYYVVTYVPLDLSTKNTPNLTLLRWVDRDMFMRYLGGGIGHLKQDVQSETTSDMDVDSNPEDCTVDSPHTRPTIEDKQPEALEALVGCSDDAEKEMVEPDGPHSDSGSNSDSDSDSDSSVGTGDCSSDDDLGPEDGENSDDDDDGYTSF